MRAPAEALQFVSLLIGKSDLRTQIHHSLHRENVSTAKEKLNGSDNSQALH
jgi:hypothetical protein